jgi:hypothetical protein
LFWKDWVIPLGFSLWLFKFCFPLVSIEYLSYEFH